MKRKRGLTKGSNIGLTKGSNIGLTRGSNQGLIAGSNKGSNLFSVDLLEPSLYDIPIGVTPKGPPKGVPKGPKGLPKGPRGLRPAPKPGEIPPTLEVLKQKYDVRSKLIRKPVPKWLGGT